MAESRPDPANAPPLSPGEGNKQPAIIATTVTVTALTDIVLVLRFITRKWIVKSLGWDDWTIFAAMIGKHFGFAFVLVEVHYGFGRHKWDLNDHDFREFNKYSYGEWIQTFATLTLTKVSICLFLLRIVISKSFMRSLWTLITALVASNIVLTVLWIVQCRPISDAWIAPETPGTCFSRDQLRAIILAQALISVGSDFILAAYPIFILRKLQMSFHVKVGLGTLMGLGVITGSFCIVRTVGNWQNVNDDPTWNSVVNWYWRSWEVNIGIIAASIPTLRPGYRYLVARHQKRRLARSNATMKLSDQPSGSTYVEEITALPQFPASALRPDRGHVNATCTTSDGDTFPIQMNRDEIMKTTTIDLESQRSGRSRAGVESEIDKELERMDSKAELKGAGRLM